MPNIIDWVDESFGFCRDLQALQGRSMQALHDVLDLLARESDDLGRLRLYMSRFQSLI